MQCQPEHLSSIKKGEFLEKISALDSIGGWMKHLFEYLSGSLKDVTFEVYALEDIKAADGESEDYYKKGCTGSNDHDG